MIEAPSPTMPRETKIDPQRLDKTRRRVWDLLQSEGVDMKQASGYAGRGATYMRDYFVKGHPEELPEQVREALAPHLNVQPDFFRKTWSGSNRKVIDRTATASHKDVVSRNLTNVTSIAGAKKTSAYQKADELVPVIGEVQAGAWREAYQFPIEEWEEMRLPVDSMFPGVARYALINRGQSMNRTCQDGGKWIFVRLEELTGVGVSPGDYIVVERRRGDLVEATCKVFRLDREGRKWGDPESDDPSFEPIPLDSAPSDTDEIRVIGICIDVMNPLRRRRP